MKRKASSGRLWGFLAMAFLLTMLFGLSAQAGGTITPRLLNDFEVSATGVPASTLTLPAGTTQDVYTVNMAQRGLLKLDLSAAGLPGGIQLELYSNSACTNKVGYSGYISSSTLSSTMKLTIQTPGTYYLKVYRGKYAAAQAASFQVRAYCYSGEAKNLQNKVWSGTYPVDYNEVIFHKVVVKKTGTIQIEGYGEGSNGSKNSINVALYNNKKKAAGSSVYLTSSNGYTAYYGVKKGTYYIGVKGYNSYKMRYTFTSVKDKNISSQKKAQTIKRGKAAKGLLVAGESGKKTEWYKFKLTSNKKVSITLTPQATGSIRLQIIPANKRGVVNGSISTYNTQAAKGATRGKLKKGTYYIKISRLGNDKTTSGAYTVKWK